jgi:hypothetical protein
LVSASFTATSNRNSITSLFTSTIASISSLSVIWLTSTTWLIASITSTFVTTIHGLLPPMPKRWTRSIIAFMVLPPFGFIMRDGHACSERGVWFMGFLKTMTWSWKDIWILKWCAFVFGMIAGAYLSEFIKQNIWIFALVAVILTVRPAIKYFGKNE